MLGKALGPFVPVVTRRQGLPAEPSGRENSEGSILQNRAAQLARSSDRLEQSHHRNPTLDVNDVGRPIPAVDRKNVFSPVGLFWTTGRDANAGTMSQRSPCVATPSRTSERSFEFSCVLSLATSTQVSQASPNESPSVFGWAVQRPKEPMP